MYLRACYVHSAFIYMYVHLYMYSHTHTHTHTPTHTFVSLQLQQRQTEPTSVSSCCVSEHFPSALSATPSAVTAAVLLHMCSSLTTYILYCDAYNEWRRVSIAPILFLATILRQNNFIKIYSIVPCLK
jgi:hypothetical protein